MRLTAIDFNQATLLYSYQEFKQMVAALFEQGRVTGAQQSTSLLEVTGMNLHRMKRIDKTGSLNENIEHALQAVKSRWTWYLITEGWCGDSSQNAPIIARIAESSPNIDLKLLLRDENPELMDNYLTNGSKAVPKLICIDNETDEILGTWGPRPQRIQDLVKAYKLVVSEAELKKNPEMEKLEFAKNLHLWYARDKGKALQDELTLLINEWKNK